MHDVNLIISSLRGGGAERVAVQLCNGWVEQGLSVAVTTLSDHTDDDYILSADVHRVALAIESESANVLAGIMANLFRVRALRKALQANPARNFVGFSGTSNILLLAASAGLKSRVIVAERNYPPESVRGRLWQTLRKHLYRYADYVVVQTKAGAQWLADNTSARQTVVIPNSLTWPIPEGVPVLNPASLVDENKKLLLAVGNIQAQKGFDLLLAAVAQSAFVNSNWVLVIVGAGNQEALQRLIVEHDLSSQVMLAGRVGNVGHWYERADAFVLSSRYEGFPNVLLEAMASGCAVVSFDCPTGPADMIEHESNGLLATAGDVTALSAELNKVMADEALRNNLATNAKSVKLTFSSDAMFGAWSSILSRKGLR